MGFPPNTRIPDFDQLLSLLLYLTQVMLAMAVLSWVPFFTRPNKEEENSAEESRPPASLVEVPVHLVARSIQEKLPVMEFGQFVAKLGRREREEGSTCAVCLRRIEEEDEVRELSNCVHAFHRECLDGWIGRGGATCPLCRSKLLPDQETSGEPKCGGDLWRRERMFYLFGEDCVFGDSDVF
ncbi:hypothetical protein NMG60_11020061 [Bertholletia excelsa]